MQQGPLFLLFLGRPDKFFRTYLRLGEMMASFPRKFGLQVPVFVSFSHNFTTFQLFLTIFVVGMRESTECIRDERKQWVAGALILFFLFL